jgi:hypothetical protein
VAVTVLYRPTGVTTPAAASSTKPKVEKVERKTTQLLTFDVAAPSLLKIVDHQEPFRKRPVTDLPDFSKRKGSEQGYSCHVIALFHSGTIPAKMYTRRSGKVDCTWLQELYNP